MRFNSNKYRAKKVKADGYTFDSISEYERYLILKQLLGFGQISELKIHPRFWIHVNGERAFQYEADFAYLDHNGKIVVEDVKGFWTDMAKLKTKCFRLQYPTLPLIIIRKGKVVVE